VHAILREAGSPHSASRSRRATASLTRFLKSSWQARMLGRHVLLSAPFMAVALLVLTSIAAADPLPATSVPAAAPPPAY